MPLRILTGRVTIERDGRAIDQNAFPGKRGTARRFSALRSNAAMH
jgi:hypothetical protein